jgi:hypothetical protein
MLITYLIVSLVIGCFLACIWTGKNLLNVAIKVILVLYTLWTVALLLGAIGPEVISISHKYVVEELI